MELGRRHHEHDMRGRLLDRLEQRVEGGARQLVHLVNDEHLISIANGGERQVVDDDFANRVDTRVARRIDLEDVDVAPLRNLDARVANAAGIGGRSLDAAQRARQDARRRRLAGSALARKHERLRDAAAGDRIAQRTRHRLLPDDVIEALGTPLSGENLIGHKWKS